MSIKNNKWLFIKMLFLGYILFYSGNNIPDYSEGNYPPYWIFIVIFAFFAVFLPSYLKAFKTTKEYINESVWNESPLKPFHFPLPFYHLCSWVGIIAGINSLILYLFDNSMHHMMIALFAVSSGAGCFCALWLTKQSINKTNKDGEPGA